MVIICAWLSYEYPEIFILYAYLYFIMFLQLAYIAFILNTFKWLCFKKKSLAYIFPSSSIDGKK